MTSIIPVIPAGITAPYPCSASQPKVNDYKTERQVANATFTAAGVGATAYAGNRLIDKISRLEAAAPKVSATPTKGVIGNVLVKKGFLGRTLDNVSNWLCGAFEKLGKTKFVESFVNMFQRVAKTLANSKTGAAVAITGVLAIVGLLGKAIYNAGKING